MFAYSFEIFGCKKIDCLFFLNIFVFGASFNIALSTFAYNAIGWGWEWGGGGR